MSQRPNRSVDSDDSPPVVHRQARGEQRRVAILRAVWQVVLRDGVRGVRHRAVAEAAQVPLAATTYYFKDIEDLLLQSFELFADEAMNQFVLPFWAEAEQELGALRAAGDREVITDTLVRLAATYITRRLHEHRDQLIVEYAFWYAALQQPRLQVAVRQMGRRWMQMLQPWLEAFQSSNPEQAARCLLATVRRIEYEGLIEGTASQRPGWIEEALSYQVRGLW